MINRAGLRDFLRALCDLVLPRTCVVCGRPLALHEKHICPSCLSDLPRTHFSNLPCNQMADRFNALVQRDLADAGGYESYIHATALFFYRSSTPYSKITQRLKYHSDLAEGRYFANMLGREMLASDFYRDVDAVVPVPLHWSRRWSRGYNQAEVIASEVAGCLGAELRCDILERPRRTRTQTKMSIEQKALNVRGAFTVRKDARLEACSHILIIDDVFTTGATVHSCYLALREVLPPKVKISVATLGCVGG